jgi:hypothetical protein
MEKHQPYHLHMHHSARKMFDGLGAQREAVREVEDKKIIMPSQVLPT